MGTVVSRRRKDGSLAYTAQIRIHRQGRCIHSESETFDRRQLATIWMRRREAELDQQRARGEPLGKGVTLAELLRWYGKVIRELTPWGRSKAADLKRLASTASQTRMCCDSLPPTTSLTSKRDAATVQDRPPPTTT